MLRAYKTDLDYLKSQLKTQYDIVDTLNDTLQATRDELETCQRESSIYYNKYNDINKRYTEEVVIII